MPFYSPPSRTRSVSYSWNAVDLAASTVFFTADRAYNVKSMISRVDVAGVDLGGVTALIRKVPSGTAVGSGTSLHSSGSINLKGSANTNQALSLTAGSTLASGDSLAFSLTGVPTTAQGSVTVLIEEI